MNIRIALYAVMLLGSSSLCFSQNEKKTTITAQKEKETTIEDAVAAAYRNNNEWKAEQSEKKIAEERYSQSRIMFLPSVDAHVGNTLSSSRGNRRTIAGNYDGQEDSKGNSKNTKIGVSIRQNVFSGFSTLNNMQASEYESIAAYHKLKTNEQKLIMKVVEAYSNIWLGLKKVDALKKKEKNFQKILSSQQSGFDVGVATSSDVASANANYQKAVYERIAAETELFSAESEFEKLTGTKATKNINLPELKFDLPKSLEEFITHAAQANSNILHTKIQELSALKALDAARGRLSPSCDLTLTAERTIGQNKDITSRSETTQKSGTNAYTASLDVTIPIFSNTSSNGNTYSQIDIANQSALKAKYVAEDALLDVKKDCVISWNTYISSNAMIESSASAVKSAELSSGVNLEKISLGVESNSDAWVKENNLLESRINLATSQRQKFVVAFRMLALIGDLDAQYMLHGARKRF
jgi:outer membrane protein TolC